MLRPANFKAFAFVCDFRSDAVGGHEHKPHHAHPHHRVPAVLRDRVARTAGGACHRPRGWHGVIERGAAGAGRLPAGRPHQEDQSRLAGKSVQTEEGPHRPPQKDHRQSHPQKETLLSHLVKIKKQEIRIGARQNICLQHNTLPVCLECNRDNKFSSVEPLRWKFLLVQKCAF